MVFGADTISKESVHNHIAVSSHIAKSEILAIVSLGLSKLYASYFFWGLPLIHTSVMNLINF